MNFPINKDTQLCMSLSARPGNFGTRLHNFLYQKLNLNFVYKAFTTQDLQSAVAGIRALEVRGSAISMPFKEDCIALLNELDPSSQRIHSVNTIVNSAGHLKGYNTDFIAVSELLKQFEVPPTAKFILRGSGGMAKAVVWALKVAGFHNGLVVARNQSKGAALAFECGYQWASDVGSEQGDLLINVTPIGMAGGPEADELAFSQSTVNSAQFVMDAVAIPFETPLVKLARSLGKKVISGGDIISLQSIEQFVLYTGVRPSSQLIIEAAEYARSGL